MCCEVRVILKICNPCTLHRRAFKGLFTESFHVILRQHLTFVRYFEDGDLKADVFVNHAVNFSEMTVPQSKKWS